MQMPGRKYAAPNNSYRYGFSGKEKDNEVKEGGNSYDFIGRIYDPRVSRWLSVDPKASKFPYESPYVYVSNNPLIYTDPDGEEKIIVVGGGDNATKYDHNKFLNSGLLQAKNYANGIKNGNTGEAITILLNMKFVSTKQYKAMLKAMKIIEKETGVKINMVGTFNGQSTTNYINSKNSDRGILSDARTADPVTDLSFFGHGYSGGNTSNGTVKYDESTKKNDIEGMPAFEPAHGTPGEEWNAKTGVEHKNWEWGAAEAQTLNSKAFANSASIVFYSCNAATPNKSGNNLVSYVSTLVPSSTVSGAKGLTTYNFIYTDATLLDKFSRWSNGGVGPSNELPKPTQEPQKAEWHTYKNGEKQ